MSERALLLDDLDRQLGHWMGAAQTFLDAEQFAARGAWESVERSVGLPIRTMLARTVDELLRSGRTATELVKAARTTPSSMPEATQAVQRFRRLYAQVETTLDFFGDAVDSRTSVSVRTTLQALDVMAALSIEQALKPLKLPVPPVLTYIDKGLGASILRVGIRLWSSGSINPVAAIKIVRHNLYRPTSLFHETGHQVASFTGWSETMSTALAAALGDDPQLRAMWQPWSSEIVGDVFAVAHTGFASVAALYDVVGDAGSILRWPLGDPHPIGLLRTVLGCAMCRHVYGAGPWDSLERAALTAHPINRAEPSTAQLLRRSIDRMNSIAAVCLDTCVPGFGDRPIGALVDPQRVSPAALAELERSAGPSLWTSPHWRRSEGIRIVALAGLREAENPKHTGEWIERSRAWMTGAALVA